MLIVFKRLVLPQVTVAWKSLRNTCKNLLLSEVSKEETAESNVRIFQNVKF